MVVGHHVDAAGNVLDSRIDRKADEVGELCLCLVEGESCGWDDQHVCASAYGFFDHQDVEVSDLHVLGVRSIGLHERENLVGVSLLVDVEHLSVERTDGIFLGSMVVAECATSWCPDGQAILESLLAVGVGALLNALAEGGQFGCLTCFYPRRLGGWDAGRAMSLANGSETAHNVWGLSMMSNTLSNSE